jgi:WXG100 family type VII secretion target
VSTDTEVEEVTRDIDVWNPGGDPAVLRAAAEAWRGRARALRDTATHLDGRVSVALASWDGAAADAFSGFWDQRAEGMRGVAQGFDDVATELDRIADEIAETNRLVKQIYAAIGATIAIGVVSSVVTLGFGTAAAGAAAGAQAANAARIVAQLGSFLTVSVRAVSGIRAAFTAFSVRFAVGTAVSGGVGMVQRAAFHPTHDPFADWGLRDVRNLLLGGGSGATIGTFAQVGRVGTYTAAHPVISAGAQGFTGGMTTSFGTDWLDGSLDGTSPMRALQSGLWSGVTGAGLTGVGLRLTPQRHGGESLLVPDGLPHGWGISPNGLAVPGPAAPGTVPVYGSGPNGSVHLSQLPVRTAPPTLHGPSGAPMNGLTSPGGLRVPPLPVGYQQQPSGLYLPGGSTPPPAATLGWSPTPQGLLAPTGPVGFSPRGPHLPTPVPRSTSAGLSLIVRPVVSELRSPTAPAEAPRYEFELPGTVSSPPGVAAGP